MMGPGTRRWPWIKVVFVSSVTMKAAVPMVFKDPLLTAVHRLVRIALARRVGSSEIVICWNAHSFVVGSDKRWV